MRSWLYILDKIKNFEMKRGVYSFINPYSMLVLRGYPDIARNIDSWYVDGISLVNKLNRSGKFSIERQSFDDTSLAPVVFSFARRNNLSIAIVGTKQELISKAVFNIQKNYKVNVEYFRNGYFTSIADRENTLRYIYESKIDLVVCGMGTPSQENFLIDLKKMGWNGYGFTCGGYLHQVAQTENYYPKIFDSLNIRWIYRLIDEPKLFKRYAFLYPKFFVSFFFFWKRHKG